MAFSWEPNTVRFFPWSQLNVLYCVLTGELAADLASTIMSNVPSVLYSLLILVYNALYLKLARRLTIWENHRYQLALALSIVSVQ